MMRVCQRGYLVHMCDTPRRRPKSSCVRDRATSHILDLGGTGAPFPARLRRKACFSSPIMQTDPKWDVGCESCTERARRDRYKALSKRKSAM